MENRWGQAKNNMGNGDDVLLRLQSPLHQEAYKYWYSKKSGDLLPGRDAIDPLELPSVLPWLNLVDVVRDGKNYRFRHRLVGTGIVERFGRDSTGAWFDDIYDAEFFGDHLKGYADLVDKGRVDFARTPMPIPEKNFIVYQRLALPLATDGVNVDMIMIVIDFDEPRVV